MAARRRRTTKRKSSPRRAPARRRPTRRRRATRRASSRRRTRRRRNPKLDVKGALYAGAGGAVVGAAAYALEGQDMKPATKAAALAAGGLLLGALISGWNPKVGAGIAGGGMALGAKMGIDYYKAEQAKKAQTEAIAANLGRIPAYAVRRFGHTPATVAYHHLPQTHMGAVAADLGNAEVQLSGAELHMS